MNHLSIAEVDGRGAEYAILIYMCDTTNGARNNPNSEIELQGSCKNCTKGRLGAIPGQEDGPNKFSDALKTAAKSRFGPT
jgi:hypothetical protein